MIDDETRARRSVPVPRRPLDDVDLDDAPLGSPAAPLFTPVDPPRSVPGAWDAGRAPRAWDATRVSDAPEWHATRVSDAPAWDATRVSDAPGWDADATRVSPGASWDAPADATALAGTPAIEATTAISARRRAELAAESPIDATAAIASVRPVFVDERGRRTRGIKFGIYSVVAVCIVFLAVVGISLAAGNRGPLMEIPLLGGASPAEASDTVDTNEIAPPPEPVAEAPAPTTAARPAATTTRAPARAVPVAPVQVTTTAPAPTTTVEPAPTTTTAPSPTTRTRGPRNTNSEGGGNTGTETATDPARIAAPVTNP
ncbi:hypothetical protein ACFQH9_14030 [Pseudonocardia lutea]|uniref:Uncharacterized protein n=1 Tax=Pseudonocardia lutea TaxID=2172015 RepID=A0ABW1I7M0_9PSEU